MATDGQATFVYFIYTNIEWGTSNIGFNAGDGVRSFMLPGALTFQTRNVEMGSNVDMPGVYIYRVDQNMVFEPTGEEQNNVLMIVILITLGESLNQKMILLIHNFPSCMYSHSLTNSECTHLTLNCVAQNITVLHH